MWRRFELNSIHNVTTNAENMFSRATHLFSISTHVARCYYAIISIKDRGYSGG